MPRCCQVHACLYSPNWDTRVAAAATIGLLAEAFPHSSVQELAAASTQHADAQQQEQLQDLERGVQVTLQTFDLAAVLSKGQPLLASGGQVSTRCLCRSTVQGCTVSSTTPPNCSLKTLQSVLQH